MSSVDRKLEVIRKSDRDSEWHEIVCEVAPGRLGVIADTLNRDYTIGPQEDAANARLFGAAEELLEAAQNALHAFRSVKLRLPNPTEQESDQFSAVLQLSAAVAKATGEDQP